MLLVDEDGTTGKELGRVGIKVLVGIESETSVVSGSPAVEVVAVGDAAVVVEVVGLEPIVEGGLLDCVG
jgi:hypothetical protein